MEHEVYVPVSSAAVRAALADSDRVARCVPGFQLESEENEQLAGRLKLRIGGSTITYRGAFSLTPHGGTGSTAALDALERLDVAGQGSEARGEGTVELALTIEPRSADDGEGTTLVCVGTVTGTGRLAAIEEKTATSAGVRLLDRFAAALGDSIRNEPPAGTPDAADGPVTGGIGAPDDNERAIPGIPEPEPEPDRTPLSETEVPASSLGRDDESELDAAEEAGGEAPSEGDVGFGAEAAHARRTMIGRSAEEVDHAPPRGRYAPVPAPQHVSATATLRWAAPAAAAVVAGAVVLGRVLRRRR
jgi:carbon monoxide dehydrogenase subunit G